MSNQQPVAQSTRTPQGGYFANACRKGLQEREEGRRLNEEHLAQRREWAKDKNMTPQQIKKMINCPLNHQGLTN